MKHKILPIISTVLILSSCSTAYKSTQTPDDVYYSPATGIEEKETAKQINKTIVTKTMLAVTTTGI